ncbi:MAG: hypothetical protein IPP90_07980 [Gemmatimonadaceae bacterium]|nr:hypothetical protein [Gemmatimonadaceae bacterium]
MALDRVGANAGDDVVRAAFAWHAARRSSVRSGATRSHTVGVARATRTGEPTPSRETPSVRVFWPSDGVPVGWRRATTADSTGAVVANEQAVVGAWAVTAIPDTTDTAMAIAWWSDGRVAATERRTESGCDRVVAIRSTAASDALLSASANGLFDRLLAPCAPREMVSASTLVVQGVQGSALAPVTEFSGDARAAPRPVRGVTAWLIPSLYAAALLLLLLEWRVRRRPPTATT